VWAMDQSSEGVTGGVMADKERDVIMVVQETRDNGRLTVSLNGQAIGVVYQDAPKVWRIMPPVMPEFAGLYDAVAWLVERSKRGG
jgi:hypothetical protein